MKPSTLILLAIFIAPWIHAQKSLKFDGTNDYVQMSTGGPSGSTNRTVEVWVKTSQSQSKQMVLVDWGVLSRGNRFTLNLINFGKPRIEIGGNGFTSNTSVADGKWHHVAVTYNSSSSPTTKLYIDGKLDVSNDFKVTVNTNGTGPILLGRRNDAINYYKGEMDEVRIWNKALSQTEIREWMCKEVNSSHTALANLYGYWKVNNTSGTTLSDSGGNSRNGTLNNGVAWQNFGGPIGTHSVSSFSSNPTLVLKHADGDSVIVNGVTGNPGSVHLYMRSGMANFSTLPNQVQSMDSSRQWGVFMTGGSSPKYNFEYFFSANSHFQSYGSCNNALIQREDNSDTSWTFPSSVTNKGTSFQMNAQDKSEYTLGYSNQGALIVAPGGKDTTEVCTGDTLPLSSTASALGYQWLWNGQPIPGDTTSNMNATNAGSYQLVIQGGSCSDTSNPLQIQLLSLPTVTLAPYPSVCEDTFSVPFSGGLPAGGNYLSTYSSGNIFVVNASGPGLHQITYEYTDSRGCTDTASTMIEVWALPQVSLSTKTDVCADSSAHPLGGGLPAGGFYEVNGVQSTQFDPTSLGAGSHWVRYNYTDANGCSNRDSVAAVVLALPSVSLNLIKDEFCEYDATVPMDGQNPRGGLFSGAGVLGNKYDPSSAGAGNHPIEYLYTDPGTGCKNTAHDTIQVFARPATPILTQVNNTLEANSPGAAVYRWYNLTRQINGANDSIYQPIIEGDYYVQVQSAEGCWSLLSDTISYQVITGIINSEWKEHLSIYPNPVRDKLHINLKSNEFVYLFIRSMTGQVMLEQKEIDPLKSVEVGSLTPGIYLVELRNAKGELLTIQRILKE